jgi:hypothetical protein
MKATCYIIPVLLLTLAGRPLFAQTNVQVVEKTIVKNIPLSSTDVLKIVGEKAHLQINGWEENYVSLQIVFSAKNPLKETAEKELTYMKYSLSRETNSVEVRNSFIIPTQVTRVQSNLQVHYKIKVPRKSNLSISDKYGTIDMNNVDGNMLTITAEFTDINLHEIGGTITIQTNFGELRGTAIKGSLNCQSEKSQINLSGLEGMYTFNSSFGNIQLEFAQKLQGLLIKSNRTTIDIYSKKFQQYNYNLETKYSTVYIPEPYAKSVKKDNNLSSLNITNDAKNPLIKIQTTYCPITIKF